MSLLAGGRFPRWFWLGLNAGALLGTGFYGWLRFQTLYRIHALCLWCCLAWVATIVIFWGVTSFTARCGFLPAPAGLRTFLTEFAWAPPATHLAVLGTLVLTRWWSFWTGSG